MKNQLFLGTLGVALTAATCMLTGNPVQALTLTTCSADLLNGAASTCEYISDPLTGGANAADSEGDPNGIYDVNNLNGNATPLEPDNDVFFYDANADLWDYIDSSEGFTDAGTQSASYALSGFDQYMAVFKNGNNATLMAFLLKADSGTLTFDAQLWDTVLPNDNPGAVSNIRYFGRRNVPTPAVVLPILGGLFGAAVRRQKMT